MTNCGSSTVLNSIKYRHEELDKYAKEKQEAFQKVKSAAHDQERKLELTIQNLQAQLEEHKINIKKLQWNEQDITKDKNSTIER